MWKSFRTPLKTLHINAWPHSKYAFGRIGTHSIPTKHCKLSGHAFKKSGSCERLRILVSTQCTLYIVIRVYSIYSTSRWPLSISDREFKRVDFISHSATETCTHVDDSTLKSTVRSPRMGANDLHRGWWCHSRYAAVFVWWHGWSQCPLFWPENVKQQTG